MLLGLPILQYLGVDTKTLLEDRRDLLDGTDCGKVSASARTRDGKTGKIGRLMLARLNRVENEAVVPTRQDNTDDADLDAAGVRKSSVDYYEVRDETDPFPDASIIDSLHVDQKQDIEAGMEKMLRDAAGKSLPEDHAGKLEKMVRKNADIFRTSLSSGPPAKVEPLRIELSPDAKPTRVHLQNYSQEQRAFLVRSVTLLVAAGMAYFNPSAAWACALLLVPKDGPSIFRFTVFPRPINRFTLKHQFPMPNLEHELAKLAKSLYFAIYDLSHGYWQLPLAKCSQEC